MPGDAAAVTLVPVCIIDEEKKARIAGDYGCATERKGSTGQS